MAHVDREKLAYFLSKLQTWVASYAPSKDVATSYSPGLMSSSDKAKLDGLNVDSALNASSVNPVQNRVLSQALQGYEDRISALEDAGATAYTYKGSVPTKADLPASGNAPGDVYDVLTAPDDGSWAWTGTEWSKLSGFVDLSALATKDVATPVSDGLMSASDKSSLDALLQGLVPLWSSAQDYAASMLVRGSNGMIYLSKQASGPGTAAFSRDPASDDGTYWGRIPSDDSGLVHKTGAETVSGQKTFSQPVVGDVLASASGSGTVPRLLSDRASDVVNVRDFGAVGDGVANDVAAFAAASAAGDTIFCPSGTYYLPTEPQWASGKNIVVYSTADDVSFTGNYGANRVGGMNRGFTFRQLVSDGQTNNRNILTMYQAFTDGETPSVLRNDGVRGCVYARTSLFSDYKKMAWAITGIVNVGNSASGSEPVGVAGQCVRDRVDSITPSWAMLANAVDKTTNGCTAALVGIEVDCVTNGTCVDHGYNKVGVDVRMASYSNTAYFTDSNNQQQRNLLGYGVRVAVRPLATPDPQDSLLYSAICHAAFEIGYGEYHYGLHVDPRTRFTNAIIDLTSANFESSSTPVALHLRNNHKIAFTTDTVNGPLMGSINGNNIEISFAGDRAYFFDKEYFAASHIYLGSTAIPGVATNPVAISMKQGRRVHFTDDTTNGPAIYAYASNTIAVSFGGENKIYIDANGIGGKGYAFYRYSTDGQGNETYAGKTYFTGQYGSGSATASFNATNKPGSTNVTAPSRWLRVEIDGIPFWLPLFSN